MERFYNPLLSRGGGIGNYTLMDQQNYRKKMELHYQKAMELQKLATAAHKQFSVEQAYVSLALAKQVYTSEAKDRNLVFSPLSINVVLGLVAAGSTGKTQEEVLSYLKSASIDDFGSSISQLVTVLFADGTSLGGPCLSSANGVWVDQRFALKERFKEIAEKAYKVAIDEVDFKNQAEKERRKLNLWAEEQTNGLIKDILPYGSVDEYTELVFGNAVYFKGAWKEIFAKSRTRDYDFFLLNGDTVKVPFMTNSNSQRVSAFDGFKVLGMMYKHDKDVRKFSMYIFLPDSKDGLPSLVEKITPEPGFTERHLPTSEYAVGDFRIPKFKICFDFDAKKVLKELGLVSVFSGGVSEVVDEDVKVSSVLHKSFIEVNEGGTEAAAATYILSAPSYCPGMISPEIKTIDFVAEHPFLFIIREDITGMLLFIGHVVNPLME